jgi:hypothetical protein
MRVLFALLLVAIMLVSHGGMFGLVPHAAPAHSHTTEGEHFSLVAADEGADMDNAGVDLPTSDNMAPAPAAHSHVAVGLFEDSAFIVFYKQARDLPLPGSMPRLMGREVAPAPEPPSA